MTEGLADTALERIRRRTPLDQWVGVDDVAGAVCFLMSDAGKAMTGMEWIVDGGSTA